MSLQVLTIIQGTLNVPFVLVIVAFLSDAITWDAAPQGSCSSYFSPTVALPLRPEPDLNSTYLLTDSCVTASTNDQGQTQEGDEAEGISQDRGTMFMNDENPQPLEMRDCQQ